MHEHHVRIALAFDGLTRPLSDLELLVLAALAEGRTTKQVAGDLRLSVRAVTVGVTGLFEAFGARSRAHLVHLAWRAGIFTLDRIRAPATQLPATAGENLDDNGGAL